MALEALAQAPENLPGGWRDEPDGVHEFRPLLDRKAGMEAQPGADLFHGTLAAGRAEWAAGAARATGIGRVALGGGCFLNRVLTGLVAAGLMARGLEPLAAGRLSPGDGALAAGQAWVAALAENR
jgi:hydrogenase maturation protein HypF